MITIRTVDADGKLDASYANPRPLPFYNAVATKDGNAVKLLFELRAGGYNGSTYTLSYDATHNRMTNRRSLKTKKKAASTSVGRPLTVVEPLSDAAQKYGVRLYVQP